MMKTAEEKLKESERRYRVLTQASPDCIKMFDRKGRLVFINAAGLAEHGLKDIGGAKKWDYLASIVRDDREKFKDAFNKALTGETTTIEIRHVAGKSDKEVCLETITPVKDGKNITVNVFGVSRDITGIKKMDREKTEFISVASHQLRTPLSSISLIIEMLLRGAAGGLNGEQISYLNSALEETKEMIGMIEKLLNVSRIEMGTALIEPKPTDLAALLDKLAREFEPKTRSKKLKLKKSFCPDIPAAINIDQDILRHVLSNLLMNSIKYTQSGGTIELKTGRRKSDIVIEVSDNGPGIPEELKPKIFTKLFRAYDMFRRNKIADGSGMGLYIAKSFVEQAGGKIWFESKKGEGTTFCVSFPLRGMAAKGEG